MKFEEIRQKSDLYSGLEEIFKEDEKYLGPKLNNTVISKPKTKGKKYFKKPKTYKKKIINFRFKNTNHRQGVDLQKKERNKKKIIRSFNTNVFIDKIILFANEILQS